jgi:hypothetical protein
MFLCTPCKIKVSMLFYCDIKKSLKTFALTEELSLNISRCLIEFSVSERFEKNLSKASWHTNLQFDSTSFVKLGNESEV